MALLCNFRETHHSKTFYQFYRTHYSIREWSKNKMISKNNDIKNKEDLKNEDNLKMVLSVTYIFCI